MSTVSTVARRITHALFYSTAVAAAASATPLSGQTIRGTVRDANGRAVAGALISLFDSASTTLARALSGGSGDFRLTAPYAGTFRLRTARIGFRPDSSPAFTLRSGETRHQDVRVAFTAVPLSNVRVSGRSPCRTVSIDSAADVFGLWDQARTALAATQVTAASRAISVSTLLFERSLDRAARRIRSQSVKFESGFAAQPWRAAPLDSLRRAGYVTSDDNGEHTYYAPDLETLLSREFLEDHCVKVAVGGSDSEVGLAFEPTPNRTHTAEIRGTAWLDRESGRLTRLEYAYVNVPSPFGEQAGGVLRFAPLRDGGWAIVGWEIRMPAPYRDSPRGPWRVAELRSTGGELIVARRGSDTLYRRPAARLNGVVVDSSTSRSIANARITLVGTPQSATTDERGRFTIRDILPGTYSLDVRTVSLDSVGTVHRSELSFADSSTLIRVAVPTAAQVAATLCGSDFASAKTARAGAVLGTVIFRGDTSAPASLRVVADWTEYRSETGHIIATARRVETRSDSRGSWRLCGLPQEQLLTIRALPGEGRVRPVNVRIEADQRFASAELVIDRALPSLSSFEGLVIAADSSATPLVNAEVLFPDLGLSTRTNALGGFKLAEIPPGSHRVIVRRVGYGVLQSTIGFSPNDAEVRRIVLSRVNVLDSVVVRADNVIPSFEENRRVGQGHFLTRADLAGMENRSFAAVLANLNGARIVSGNVGSYAWLARSRGAQSIRGADETPVEGIDRSHGAKPGCYAHVYLDNAPIYIGNGPLFNLNSISPDRIEAVEYYASAAQTPARYSRLGATCGVLVIWSRRSE